MRRRPPDAKGVKAVKAGEAPKIAATLARQAQAQADAKTTAQVGQELDTAA